MAPGGTHVSVCGELGPPWGPFFGRLLMSDRQQLTGPVISVLVSRACDDEIT